MSNTAAAHPRLRPRTAPAVPRRRSGPASRPRGVPAIAPSRTLVDTCIAAGRRLGDARLLDRLVRGRAWIAIMAVSLLGVVFMQVSLLRLNAGVSTAVSTSDRLERENGTLRGQISELDSGERIQGVAGRLGMVMAPAGDVHYLDARQTNARVAAAAITAPASHAPAPVPASTAPAAPVVAQPAAAVQAPAAPPAPAVTQAAAPAQAAAPTQTAAQAPAPAAAPAQSAAPATAPAATAVAAGGATAPGGQG